MRQTLSGAGIDTTSLVAAYLLAGNKFHLANLYLIGDFDDPAAVWLTDWESPLSWPIWGTFQPAVVTRNTIDSKIGLEVTDLEFTWTPANSAPTPSIAAANPYQLAQIGYYDNKLFRCWIVFMPTPGDANTYGAAAFFGGRVSETKTARGKITFTINSFLDVVNEYVPTNVIELTSTAAGYAGATPPAGLSAVPQFSVIADATSTVAVTGAETSPNPGQVFAQNHLAGGFLVFNGGPGTTLARVLSRIAANNVQISGSDRWNNFVLYDPLPWVPTPGVDTFYVSASSPINQGQIGDVEIDAAGSGYVVGDVVSITGGGGTGAAIQVTSINGGGGITGFEIMTTGSGYMDTTGAATSGGTGAGATFDINIAEYQGFPYVPAPQSGL